MEKYTIFCTESQAMKALELGAHLENMSGTLPVTSIDGVLYDIPTAEQMIGWLEVQGIVIIFMATMKEALSGYTWIAHICHFEDKSVWVDAKNLSRKDATLAAIDAALDYLINNKK